MNNIETSKQITRKGQAIRVLSPAKINLTLLVAGKRPDGFHELETIMAKTDFYDELIIEPGDKQGIEFICTGSKWAPKGEENLVFRAAKLFLGTCGKSADVKITLIKNVPAGSGLGGASSNAASTLLGLKEFLDVQIGQNELINLAARLGSDTAFFLGGPMALCTGRGEKIKKLDKDFEFTALLLLPNVNVSTAKVYANYRHQPEQFEHLKRKIDNYIRKNRVDLAVKMCANMLQDSCFSLCRELAELKAQVETLGIGPLCLSGSGSAMYYIFEKPAGSKGEEYRQNIRLNTNCDCVIINNNRW
ncbi:MAG: 4-(cytidine 5'-diphospho)-2-C-methyl-D-erythritol kinase [Phycisphaerae bacterium]